MKKKKIGNRIYYEMKWKGYNHSENTDVLRTELMSNDETKQMVIDFEAGVKQKAKGVVERLVSVRKIDNANYWTIKWVGKPTSENKKDVLSTDLQKLPWAKRDYGMGKTQKEVTKRWNQLLKEFQERQKAPAPAPKKKKTKTATTTDPVKRLVSKEKIGSANYWTIERESGTEEAKILAGDLNNPKTANTRNLYGLGKTKKEVKARWKVLLKEYKDSSK